ncbi:dihydrofolate reductase family protein [Actinomadura rugatobispora]|uniref:Dihydrofolate reductase family protein n=1 Tax=Actinomadura rugatobispora TaxID=1994 RepID=A0ABW0ZY50_9ACTN|nr:dihydrofolate reductase family protein [Actinomadura rugatobispora]
MRGLTYFVGASIDGFIAGPGGSISDFFPLPDGMLDLLVQEYPDTIPTHLHETVGARPNGRFDTVVMGRATYEPGVREGVTSPYGHLRQYVVSSTMKSSPDPALELIRDDPAAAVRALKCEEGAGVWLAGGAALAGTLLDEIDELVVKVYPFVMGSGIPLFTAPFASGRFRLADHRTVAGGAAVNTYAKQ